MSDDNSHEPAPSDRREAVREKAEQVHARQTRTRLIKRTALIVVAAAVLAAAGVGIGMTVNSAANEHEATPANMKNDGFAVTRISGAAAPASASASAKPTASAAPAVDIRVYVDYLSQGAKEWQLANAQQLGSWVNEGAATLSYHPVATLTAKSNGTKYSLRAASAAACVATHDPGIFFAFTNELMVRQPALDDSGFSNTELADIAAAVGATSPQRIRTCVEKDTFDGWVKDATERAVAGADGAVALTGTPLVLVNGAPYQGSLGDAAEFAQFVLTSASDAYYKTQTQSPTASPSATAKPKPTPSASATKKP